MTTNEWVKKSDVIAMTEDVRRDSKAGGWNGVEAALLMESSVSGLADAELQYLLTFMRENDFSGELMRDQLRALWTAYCFHHDLDVDTRTYDETLLKLWKTADKAGDNYWRSFKSFDSFMCAFLV